MLLLFLKLKLNILSYWDFRLLSADLCLCSSGRHSESVRELVPGAANSDLSPFNTNQSPSNYDILLPPQGSSPQQETQTTLTSPIQPQLPHCWHILSVSACLLCVSVFLLLMCLTVKCLSMYISYCQTRIPDFFLGTLSGRLLEDHKLSLDKLPK